MDALFAFSTISSVENANKMFVINTERANKNRRFFQSLSLFAESEFTQNISI